jgi:RNA polymerase sigma factor (sigma-70 family)
MTVNNLLQTPLLRAKPAMAAKPLSPDDVPRIYETYGPLVRSALWRHRVLDEHAREDLAQEVFLLFVQKVEAWAPRSIAQVKVLLWRCARTAALEWHRQRRRRRAESLDEGPADWPGDDGELAVRCRECLDRLPDGRVRDVLMLKYVYGLEHVQIASVLNAPKGTIDTWASRGRAQLRQCLESQES